MSAITKAMPIKLVIFDIDGVFTDGRIYVNDQGLEIKAFHAQDGQGIKLLQQTAIDIAVISGSDSPSVTHRMVHLGIRHIYQGQTQKLITYEKLLNQLQLADGQVAYVGDDLQDIPLMKRVGLAIAVANAVPEVKEVAMLITRTAGGKGAVREVCELLMRAQQAWDNAVQQYLIA